MIAGAFGWAWLAELIFHFVPWPRISIPEFPDNWWMATIWVILLTPLSIAFSLLGILLLQKLFHSYEEAREKIGILAKNRKKEITVTESRKIESWVESACMFWYAPLLLATIGSMVKF